ncbi:hypothetical protein NTE11_002018 [Vibrio fluvialis]|uniref:hypothetical protein n=1 Tax=Vibrio fluvialis TaxID=676 RepID=UPI001559588E|nr:hypothetical protein [Vibrio fluvialis]EKO3451099.1 hypothetical protein [Vibrio fluvialis]EKO3460136.1 hypothetical protein [Vibrio fluvialis]ELL9329632.1 hypothetical protein [Vibrio fluvialis]EMA2480675.1 hypothetical protein [Vibrio fluvialis]MBY7904623.1 hypothetical protein [Vibrio fluvialis]
MLTIQQIAKITTRHQEGTLAFETLIKQPHSQETEYRYRFAVAAFARVFGQDFTGFELDLVRHLNLLLIEAMKDAIVYSLTHGWDDETTVQCAAEIAQERINQLAEA